MEDMNPLWTIFSQKTIAHWDNPGSIPDNFEGLLKKSYVYCFYSDIPYFKDPPTTLRDIINDLEGISVILLQEVFNGNDIAYADTDAILATGSFTSEDTRPEAYALFNRPPEIESAARPGTSLESHSAQPHVVARNTPPLLFPWTAGYHRVPLQAYEIAYVCYYAVSNRKL